MATIRSTHVRNIYDIFVGNLINGTRTVIDVVDMATAPTLGEAFAGWYRLNIPFRLTNRGLSTALPPLLFFWDGAQNKYRFWLSVNFTSNGNGTARFSLRQRKNPLRIDVAGEGQNNVQVNFSRNTRVTYGGHGTFFHPGGFLNALVGQPAASHRSCNPAIFTNGGDPTNICGSVNVNPGGTFNCNTGYRGAFRDWPNGIHKWCWINLSENYTFLEIFDVRNGTIQGGIELLLPLPTAEIPNPPDRRALY